MGVTDIFDEYDADLSGISSSPLKLHVSHAIYRAFVEVNEKGIEAAAATAVPIAKPKSILPTRVRTAVFRVDHSFLFMICQKKSNAILFMGRVIKPESTCDD